MKKIALSLGVVLLASGMYGSASASGTYFGEKGVSGINQLDAGFGRFQLKSVTANVEGTRISALSAALAAKSERVSSLMDKWNSSESEDEPRGHSDVEDSLEHVLGAPSLGEQAREMFRKDRDESGAMYEQAREHARKHFKTKYVAPVPEPEVYALMLGGVGLVGAMARRRQRKSV